MFLGVVCGNTLLVLRCSQMVQSQHNRLARPTGPRAARPEHKPCAGHPRKPARRVPRLVDGRIKPWSLPTSGSGHSGSPFRASGGSGIVPSSYRRRPVLISDMGPGLSPGWRKGWTHFLRACACPGREPAPSGGRVHCPMQTYRKDQHQVRPRRLNESSVWVCALEATDRYLFGDGTRENG
jgi:hypothetical protein